MESHCLAMCGEIVAAFGDGFVPDFEGAGSSKLGTARYEIARLAPTKAEDRVMPTRAAATDLGGEVAILGTEIGLYCKDGRLLGRGRYTMIS